MKMMKTFHSNLKGSLGSLFNSIYLLLIFKTFIMKKYFILYGLPLIIITGLCLYPISDDVTIEKESIEGNYPFAGELKLNGEKTFVTTEVAAKYWVDYDNQPDAVTIHTTRYGLIGYLLGIGIAE